MFIGNLAFVHYMRSPTRQRLFYFDVQLSMVFRGHLNILILDSVSLRKAKILRNRP